MGILPKGKVKTMKCAYCGKEYEPKKAGRTPKYCSRECCRAADRDNKRMRYVWKSEKADKCLQCGKEIPARSKKFCSAICRRKYRDIRNGIIHNHGELTKICPVCGIEFKTWRDYKETCSKRCSNKKHDAERQYKDITVDKDISLEKLAKRDNNICQICGEPVDWNDYLKTDKTFRGGNKYPSIDHIRPVSLGGLHAWDNVQLAHRVCNSIKRNRYTG